MYKSGRIKITNAYLRISQLSYRRNEGQKHVTKHGELTKNIQNTKSLKL
jgi:hypothetical protein